MVEDHGFQTPLGSTSGPAIDHRTVDDTGLDSFKHPNPFQLLDDEDEDADIETYLHLQRKHFEPAHYQRQLTGRESSQTCGLHPCQCSHRP